MTVPLHVLVGLVRDARGRYLINQRGAGRHMAGAWEFPGGKRRPGEPRFDALRRELAEELGIVVETAEPFIEIVHDYPDRRVTLDVWRVSRFTGEPAPLEGQPLRWVTLDELGASGLLPADRPIVDALAGDG